jgi:hypothetical protein
LQDTLTSARTLAQATAPETVDVGINLMQWSSETSQHGCARNSSSADHSYTRRTKPNAVSFFFFFFFFGQVTLKRFVKCFCGDAHFMFFSCQVCVQHVLIINFGRVKFLSQRRRNTDVSARTPIDRARCRVVRIVWGQLKFVLPA